MGSLNGVVQRRIRETEPDLYQGRQLYFELGRSHDTGDMTDKVLLIGDVRSPPPVTTTAVLLPRQLPSLVDSETALGVPHLWNVQVSLHKQCSVPIPLAAKPSSASQF